MYSSVRCGDLSSNLRCSDTGGDVSLVGAQQERVKSPCGREPRVKEREFIPLGKLGKDGLGAR